MAKHKATALIVTLLATGGLAACNTTPEQGPVENAAATAGRVVDDTAITAKVKTALIRDDQTKAYQIEVETFQGQVQLSGWVDSEAARERAAQVARNVEGVRDVENDLQLRDQG